MSDQITTTDEILVVGSGPVGLMMAAELARHGAACRIVDKASGPSTTSKALGIQARTLEIFSSIGLAEQVVSEGHKVHGVNMYAEGKRLVHVSMDEMDSAFPFTIILPQSDTERILAEHLKTLGVAVQRDTELTGLSQTEDSVTSVLNHADGRVETIKTPWVIGCDGAHSAVRHQLGLQFEGEQYEEAFLLADVGIAWSMPDDEMQTFFHEDGLIVFFPFGKGRIRVVASLAEDHAYRGVKEPTLEMIQQLTRERVPLDVTLKDASWISAFRISHRRVSNYRKGRVFVAGDAAHIHSPAGGQGMNTGIQDAHNLAWKLALVQTGRGNTQLLDSYSEERVPVAKDVVSLSDRMTVLATLRHPIARHLRDRVAHFLMGIETIQQRLAFRLAELAVNYRGSSIVSEKWGGGFPGFHSAGPAPGDRAIDGSVIDAGTIQSLRLFEALRGTKHSVLIFAGQTPSGDEHRSIEEVGRALEQRYSGRVSSCLIARGGQPPAGSLWPGQLLLDAEGVLHQRYAAGAPCLYIIRPDGYVAFRCLPLRAEDVLEYLGRVFT